MGYQRILMVEDDPDVGALVAANLSSAHVGVTLERHGTRGLALASEYRWNLVILDCGLPGTDGLEICRRLSARSQSAPIILLTARTLEEDRVLGLDGGAVDYVTKPFGMEELKARVRVHLRQRPEVANAQSSRLVIDDVELDPDSRVVRRAGLSISLTTREFELLHFLMRNAPRVYSREQLLNSVWGAAYEGYSHTVNSHINRLRAKLEVNAARPQFIVTVWGTGYRFGRADAG
jgi:two-component system, OmpR family, response regulator